MRRAAALTLLALLVMTPFFARAAGAQADRTATGRVTGVVRDPTQAVVVGAKIELKSAHSAATWTRQTDREGRFAFDAIPAGLYQLTVIVSGFQIVVVRNVRVDAGRETVVNVTLHIPPA